MKHQAVILSVIALVSTVIAIPEIHFPRPRFTLSGSIYNNPNDQLFNGEPVNFRLHVDGANNRRLQVVEKPDCNMTYYAYTDFETLCFTASVLKDEDSYGQDTKCLNEKNTTVEELIENVSAFIDDINAYEDEDNESTVFVYDDVSITTLNGIS
jgi:hypothetical protein